jgi:hypothetical protein
MTELTTVDDHARKVGLLKAVGLDKLAPEQRELALNIAKRYDLDLLLKHLVMIEGRAYITRDGLLHIAHRSGQLDGIETTEPVLVDGYWRATATVYRKDMSRGFTYYGRYPETGKNRAFAPEMAVKVGEVMALRRAFDVAAPTAEERWDTDVPVQEPPRPTTLAERVAEKRAAIAPPDAVIDLGPSASPAARVHIAANPDAEVVGVVEPDDMLRYPMPMEESDRRPVLCGNVDLDLDTGECTETIGHPGPHRNEGGVWPQGKP